MQLNKLNNIIFLKDVQSNNIEEAFIVLKDGVKIHHIKNEKEKSKDSNMNILKEAELIINEKIDKSNIDYEKFKIKELEKKIKISKIINIILGIGLIIGVIGKSLL